jgi:hypothetical protein
MSFDVDHVGAVVHVTASGDERQASAQLFAEDRTARRLVATHGGLSAGATTRISLIWKRYVGPPLPDDPEAQERALATYRVQRHDVQDAINQPLGRDPEQHCLPRLAWDGVIRVLDEHGTDLGEEELIAMPFEFEVSPASESVDVSVSGRMPIA